MLTTMGHSASDDIINNPSSSMLQTGDADGLDPVAEVAALAFAEAGAAEISPGVGGKTAGTFSSS